MSREEKKDRKGVGRGRRTASTATWVAAGRATAGPGELSVPGAAGQQQAPVSESVVRAPGAPAAIEAVSSESSSPHGPSPKGSPPGSDADEATKKMKSLEIIDLAKRPGAGLTGKAIKVLCNFYEIKMDKHLVVNHYHVEISHARMKLNQDENRMIFWTCVKENPAVFTNIYRLVYDNDHICLTLDRLKLGGGESGEVVGNFEVTIRLARMDRAESFRVVVRAASLVSVDPREAKTAGLMSERYSTPFHVLDLIFRQNRSCPLQEQMAREWYLHKSTVYKIPTQGDMSSLTAGRVIWKGLFAAARIGQDFVPFVNLDITYSGFYKEQNAVDFMIEVLNEKFGGRDRGFRKDQMGSSTALASEWLAAVQSAFRGLKVFMDVKTHTGETYRREYGVHSLIRETAVDKQFEQKMPNGGSRLISVAQYFGERYGQLRYPRLNLLHVGPKKRNIFLPLEHCWMVGNQRVKKLSPGDTSAMIRHAAHGGATSRKTRIQELKRESNFSDLDPWLKMFGIRVVDQMKEVDARILPPPKIRYGQAPNRPAIVEPRDGSWDIRGKKFFLPAGTDKIAAVIFDDPHERQRERRGQQLEDPRTFWGNFFGFLFAKCIELGMRVPANISLGVVRFINPNDVPGIEKTMTELKNKGAEYIMVGLPQKGSTLLYNEVHRVAEVVLNINCQCVAKDSVRRCMEKGDQSYVSNVALKMNTKMGGINSLTEAESLAQKVLMEQATMVLGVDVTHPAPTERNVPSVSSVVGNLDDTFMRYGTSIGVQTHRRESVCACRFDESVRERLFEYHKFVREENAKNNTKKDLHPKRIIVFRDGVAEGQFQQILQQEVAGIRRACHSLQEHYNPKLTVIVAQKRHHARFFPTDRGPKCGRAENIMPGTVIDRTITHPDQFEFYLCSHFGIQGTSRPIRYTVLLDESGFSADHIQCMTYYLCHVYARCTRAVSIPAPVYYADLAARRARGHMYHKVADYSTDTMSQSGDGRDESETRVSEDELNRAVGVKGEKTFMYFT